MSEAPTHTAEAPRKVAYLLPSLAGGGVARGILNLVAESVRRGMEVDLLLCRKAGAFQDEVPEGARLVVLRPSWPWRARSAAARATRSSWRELLRPILLPLRGARAVRCLPDLVSYLEREQPELLIATKPHTNLTALWARALAQSQTRLVVGEQTNLTLETAGPKGRKWRWRYVAGLLKAEYAAADLIYSCSRGGADDLAQKTGVPRKKIEVIYNAVVTDALRRRPEPVSHPWFADGQPPVLLGVGRLDPQKDFPTLIRAFARVRAVRPARLMILGEGRERRRLQEQAESLGVAEDFALPGFVANPSAYMAAAGVFVFSSTYEGLGNALIEAMHAGCPVVSTDCPSGPAEILEAGRYGPLVPVADDDALAEAIVGRLEAPRDSETLRKRAEQFDVATTLDRILAGAYAPTRG